MHFFRKFKDPAGNAEGLTSLPNHLGALGTGSWTERVACRTEKSYEHVKSRPGNMWGPTV